MNLNKLLMKNYFAKTDINLDDTKVNDKIVVKFEKDMTNPQFDYIRLKFKKAIHIKQNSQMIIKITNT